MGRAAIVAAMMLGSSGGALAQEPGAAKSATPDCSTYVGAQRSQCLANKKRAEGGGVKGGPNAKDAKLVNDTIAAAQVKSSAGDLAGAAAVYEQAIAAAPKNASRQYLYAGLATARRRQGIAAFNSGGEPFYPPPGSGNAVIVAANASNAALEARKIAAAKPLFASGLAAAVQAATIADAATDKSADAAIGIELRENAALLYQIGRVDVLATPRASAPLEAVWLRRWLTAASPPTADQIAQKGVPVAAALFAQDRTAGLALADELRGKTGADADGIIGYAEVIAAAKLPAGDARRVRALADLKTAEPGVTDAGKQRELRQLKSVLSTAP